MYFYFSYEDVQHRRENDREKINQWQHAIDDAQSELEMLRARWRQLTDEEKRLNGDNARIWEELQKARNVSSLMLLGISLDWQKWIHSTYNDDLNSG